MLIKNFTFHEVVDERMVFVRQIVLEINLPSFCCLYGAGYNLLCRNYKIVASNYFLFNVFSVKLEICFCIIDSKGIGSSKVV